MNVGNFLKSDLVLGERKSKMKNGQVVFSVCFLTIVLFVGQAMASNRLLYENFDDGSIDSKITPWISAGVVASVPQYNLNQVGRGGVGYCFSSGTVDQVHLAAINSLPNPWPSEEMYFSFWMRYPTFTPTDANENFKFFYPHWNGTESYVHYSATGNNTVYYSAKMNGTMVSASNWLTFPNMMDGNWHHYEFYINFQTGASKAWYDGVLKADHVYGPGWSVGEMYYIAAPSIDAEETGIFSRQVDDWEVWDGMPGEVVTNPLSEPTPNLRAN
ncbi:MAG: hypothetical protein SCI25_13625 [Desulfuromonadales bacterium]|nr:hypothetical protein [Desulfuromonadales bacterium]